jgi:hypothetical protein
MCPRLNRTPPVERARHRCGSKSESLQGLHDRCMIIDDPDQQRESKRGRLNLHVPSSVFFGHLSEGGEGDLPSFAVGYDQVTVAELCAGADWSSSSPPTARPFD